MNTQMSVKGRNGTFGAYISRPESLPAPALAGTPLATIYSYPGQWHAFTRLDGAHYNAAAATLANGRTREFLHQTLK